MENGKKLLLFDVLEGNTFDDESMSRYALIQSINILLVWNKDQMELESKMHGSGKDVVAVDVDDDDDDNNLYDDKKEKKIENLIHDSMCC